MVGSGQLLRPAPLWHPDERAFTDSNLARFARRYGFDPHHYETLHAWSVSRRDQFWSAVWDFTHVIGERGERVEVPGGPAERMFQTGWFPDARLNYTENLLRGDDSRLAVIAADEDGIHTHLTLGELRRLVAGAMHGLRRLGVGQRDVVAGILPNTIDALVALLATAALGATWAGCSPDFGSQALADRIGQVEPKALIAVDSYVYNGKRHDVRDRVAGLARTLAPGVPVIVSGTPGWQEHFGQTDAPLEYERFEFDNPLLIMFSSGTTGLPKCIVHGTGGVLLEHLKEHVLHGDVRPGDVHSWYTSTAWMMHGWVISALAAEAAVVLLDGSPLPPGDPRQSAGHLWRIAEEAGITHFGTSPRYLSALMDVDYRPAEHVDLHALRSVLSAGAPVSAEQFAWVYEHIKADQVFASISGGTEIHGCFMQGSPLHPVYPGEISCRGLGMAVSVLDGRGIPVIGVKGELVCTEPFPSAPLTFRGERGRTRYHDAYFAEHPGVWTHGDLAEVTDRGTVIVYGRSDTTLKPNGVRIGTAEIYRILETRDDIADAVVFGRVAGGHEEVVLCVIPAPGVRFDPALAADIRAHIRREASPRHVPRHVFAVTAIPYTFNGKKVEGAVRTVVAGGQVANRGSLANPECLTEYAGLFS